MTTLKASAKYGVTVGTSHVMPVPAEAAPGDIIICLFAAYSVSEITIGAGTGWTKRATISNGTLRSAVFWKQAKGDNSLTINNNLSRASSAIVVVVSGADTVTESTGTGSSSTPNPPPATETVVADNYFVVAAFSQLAMASTSAAPTGFTDLLVQESAGTNTPGCSVACAATMSNTTDPSAFASNLSAGWIAHTIYVCCSQEVCDGVARASWGDTISATEDVVAKTIARLTDKLRATEAVTPTAAIRALMSDQIAPTDALAAIVLALHNENVTLTDTSSGSLQQIALMSELMACASGYTATVEIAASLMDLLAAREALAYIQSASVGDTLALADQLTAAINALAYSSDFIALTETFTNGLIVLTGDSVAASGLTTANMNVLLSWHDAIACFTNLPLEDGNYVAWVMNAETTGMSRYTVPALNSLFDHDGRVWGVSADGLWELAGDTDDGDPIDAWIKTGHFDFGTGHSKNLPRAYLYVKTTGEMALKVTSSDRGARTERTYLVHAHQAGDDEAGRIVRLARGLKGVYWQVEIANTDGCDFEIEGCEVYPVTLSRRGQ